MIRKIRFVFAFIIFLMIGAFVFSLSVKKVEADDLVGNAAAKYYVDHVIEEEELDFGVKYHNDQGYTVVKDTSYILGFVAGNESYGKDRVQTDVPYSQNVNVLEIGKDNGVEIVPYANIRNGAWTLTTVTSFIDKYEASHPGKKVVAAINGDYFDISSERNYNHTSTGGTVSEGNYFKVNSGWTSIGFKNDGSTTNMVGNIMPQVSAKPILEVFSEDGEVIFSCDVDKVNDLPSVGETSAYFSMYNEQHHPINMDLTDAYFYTGNEIAPYSLSSVYGKGEYQSYGEGQTAANKFAIVTNNNTLREYLVKGSTIRVQYYYVGELEGVENVIGYPHNVIVNNEDNMTGEYRHPRTMIGIREDGTIIMVTVDGRQVGKGYYGVALVEMAALMRYYGCINAFNLDGGGSTTMVILQNGKFTIKNSPSDGSPRSDGNCLLVTVNVPQIEISFDNVKIDSFDVTVDVVKEIEKYKNLYIEINEERKKVFDGKIHFDGLDTFTTYSYKLYALVEEEYIGLPYTGTINTAKTSYEIISTSLSDYSSNNKDYYKFHFEFKDELSTLVTVVLVANGERFYMDKNNDINILKTKYIPSDDFYFIFTFDLKDEVGRQEYKEYYLEIEGMNASFMLKMLKDDISLSLRDLIE